VCREYLICVMACVWCVCVCVCVCVCMCVCMCVYVCVYVCVCRVSVPSECVLLGERSMESDMGSISGMRMCTVSSRRYGVWCDGGLLYHT
jgi:hypothetical protein